MAYHSNTIIFSDVGEHGAVWKENVRGRCGLENEMCGTGRGGSKCCRNGWACGCNVNPMQNSSSDLVCMVVPPTEYKTYNGN